MTPVALPYLTAARVSGPDAESFLQAQLSADIARVADGGSTFACYCSPRGQVFGLLLVCRAPEDFLVAGSASLLPGILQRLRLYVLRARVQLEAVPDAVVCGLPEAASAASEAGAFSPPDCGLVYQVRSGSDCSAAAADRWKERELRRGIAWLGPETTERFIPQMLGFEALGAVSFSKGCYPGQEIVARAKYLGKVKRAPQRLRVDTAPIPAGSAVRLTGGGGSVDGAVVDSVVTTATAAGLTGGSILLVVAPEPPGPVERLDFEGNSYRCATM